MTWQVAWTAKALKDLKKLDPGTRARVVATLERFAETRSGDVVQLTDVRPPEWRIRIGSLRARFWKDSTHQRLVILRVLPRDKVY
jgi:mRNA-degrading endonuclease RelE of RelBE toxin-antitoxin system